ncbi:MAG: phospho-N-acetylmuramoyl-pentapeptide-transferase [Clostridia bacterium]|nr:phospho-N-acetylmuramoyl-pentapeptide-transferase [Clostridia bacterium]
MKNFEIFLILFISTFILTFAFTRWLIPVLKKNSVGQKILEIGPKWHKNKEGTPTMGGIGFIAAILLSSIVCLIVMFNNVESREIALLFNIICYALLNGVIGIIDDLAKLKKAENKGLSPMGKIILQGALAIGFLISIHFTVGISTAISIPFTKLTFDLGVFYYPLAFLLLCGVVNAVNLTDGLDGLASTCTLTVGVFFILSGSLVIYSTSLTVLGAVIMGGALGFLVYNLHPAKVFMGDTGSLFFGGIIAGTAFVFNNPFVVLIYGFVFVLEALTVILQVVYFKISKGKRLFKMAPLHHHLEKQGWGEMRVVSVFGIVNLLFCVLAVFMIL